MNNACPIIALADYPQLRLVAWHLVADGVLDERDAFALYERNWRFIQADALEPAERALIKIGLSTAVT